MIKLIKFLKISGLLAGLLFHTSLLNADQVEKDNLQGIENSIFKVMIGREVIGSAFLLEEKIITNSHVAAAIKYCPVGHMQCDDLYLSNGKSFYPIMGVLKNVPKLDVAVLEAIKIKNLLSLSVSSLPIRDLIDKSVTVHLVQREHGGRVTVRHGNIVEDYLDNKIKPSFGYSIVTDPDSSGSPIFYKNKVIGLHWGGENNLGKAIPIQMIINQLTIKE